MERCYQTYQSHKHYDAIGHADALFLFLLFLLLFTFLYLTVIFGHDTSSVVLLFCNFSIWSICPHVSFTSVLSPNDSLFYRISARKKLLHIFHDIFHTSGLKGLSSPTSLNHISVKITGGQLQLQIALPRLCKISIHLHLVL